tara:strand:+ start:254 stop:556 length:303 start_codon:yes stop_codon:yes gene_type:complete
MIPSFVINCRNCNDDPVWVSIAPGHTRLSCPKDEKKPSILDLMRSNHPEENIVVSSIAPTLTRSQNVGFTEAEKIYCRESYKKHLAAKTIQKFVKKYQKK